MAFRLFVRPYKRLTRRCASSPCGCYVKERLSTGKEEDIPAVLNTSLSYQNVEYVQHSHRENGI